jgi:hypothetical protein
VDGPHAGGDQLASNRRRPRPQGQADGELAPAAAGIGPDRASLLRC